MSVRLRLVGAQRVLGPDPEEVLRFYGELFARLTREVRETGDLTRYVGYRGEAGDGASLHFLGLEVERIPRIPEGMVAWELGDDAWTTWEPRSGGDADARRQPIEWRWLVESSSAAGRWCGEPTGLHVSANAYVAVGRQADSDDVALVDYDPSWPQQAASMAEWLHERLGAAVALGIEHYGSTAIEGMPAKPVVMGPRTHHVHMAPAGHEAWDAIAFRDYLRSHPDEAARYAALKRELAATHHKDRERYTLAKTRFVREATARARATTTPNLSAPSA